MSCHERWKASDGHLAHTSVSVHVSLSLVALHANANDVRYNLLNENTHRFDHLACGGFDAGWSGL